MLTILEWTLNLCSDFLKSLSNQEIESIIKRASHIHSFCCIELMSFFFLFLFESFFVMLEGVLIVTKII